MLVCMEMICTLWRIVSFADVGCHIPYFIFYSLLRRGRWSQMIYCSSVLTRHPLRYVALFKYAMPLLPGDPRIRILESLCECVPYVSHLVREGCYIYDRAPYGHASRTVPPELQDFFSVINLPSYDAFRGYFGLTTRDVVDAQRQAAIMTNSRFWCGRGGLLWALNWTPAAPVSYSFVYYYFLQKKIFIYSFVVFFFFCRNLVWLIGELTFG